MRPPPETVPSCVTESSPAPSRFALRPAVPAPRGASVIQAGPRTVLLLRAAPPDPSGPARPTQCTPTSPGLRPPRVRRRPPTTSAPPSMLEGTPAVVGVGLSVAQDWLKMLDSQTRGGSAKPVEAEERKALDGQYVNPSKSGAGCVLGEYGPAHDRAGSRRRRRVSMVPRTAVKILSLYAVAWSDVGFAFVAAVVRCCSWTDRQSNLSERMAASVGEHSCLPPEMRGTSTFPEQ
jgi:hypothetical protein